MWLVGSEPSMPPFYRVEFARRSNYDEESKTNISKTGDEIAQPSKEDGATKSTKANSADKETHRQEEMIQNLGRLLIFFGLLIVIIGVAWLLAISTPWPGTLPGDIVIERLLLNETILNSSFRLLCAFKLACC